MYISFIEILSVGFLELQTRDQIRQCNGLFETIFLWLTMLDEILTLFSSEKEPFAMKLSIGLFSLKECTGWIRFLNTID